MKGKILVVDDNKSALSALKMFLQFEFETVQCISNPARLMQELKQHEIDVVLLDMNFKSGESSGNEGLYWLREIKSQHPQTEVVIITAYGDIELAVRAIKEGAIDFVLKPWNNEKLLATLKTALRLRNSNQELKHLKQREQALTREILKGDRLIIGDSPPMLQLAENIRKVAITDANILITGENGTGKELVAREIHRLSARNQQLMVAVDLGSLSENLFESELFGHRKGSFTDAKEAREGKFVLADKGTLFLDEIGNLPLHLQSKLLSVLQNRVVIPVGSNTEEPVDIRLICATNKSLEQLVTKNLFREDLLYRINTVQLLVPSLRDRGNDTDVLAHFFLQSYTRKYNKPHLRINAAALEKLRAYRWPGNVRELQHALEKAVILTGSSVIGPEDFIFNTSDSFDNEPDTLEEMEKHMITRMLRSNMGNLTLSANKLGITRQTLYNKLKKYGL